MNVPIITQLLGGKNAEVDASETGRRGSRLATSFADMIRAALGRRADEGEAAADFSPSAP